MSLITDSFGLAAAATVAVGTVIQASQAFAELNDATPLKSSWALLRASLVALFRVVLPETNVKTMGPQLKTLQLGPAADAPDSEGHLIPADLTGAQVKSLKKWLGWFLGWFFIMIGALVALVGTTWMLVSDLWPWLLP